MAFEKFKRVNVEIQKQQDTIEVIRKDLLEEEQVIDLTEELQQKENNCKPLEEELKDLERNLQLKKTIEEQLKEIDNLSAERESAELSLKEFVDANGLKIQQHEKLRDYAEELRNWSTYERMCRSRYRLRRKKKQARRKHPGDPKLPEGC
ncbi:hypothetical protein LZ575_05400 [Antarcticibacterium sp. 1MA-6-2]|uniref:hypothetical protein n=1 Tax=Antarcticibacterium sp. 1MA-6-2 TaxID=2908210 RepID=UPI001F297DF1|nr:hypothetical protein [Antarcticibacterium sp. 1MA-6-2]UJH92042.1 hypothetical protein LZ575_05400 [Antarcticibacterium sp. 1MA-6-2]